MKGFREESSYQHSMRTESGTTDKNLTQTKTVLGTWKSKSKLPAWIYQSKLCLTNLISFYDKFAGFLAERRVVSVIYLDFNKAFDIVSNNNLPSKLRH